MKRTLLVLILTLAVALPAFPQTPPSMTAHFIYLLGEPDCLLRPHEAQRQHGSANIVVGSGEGVAWTSPQAARTWVLRQLEQQGVRLTVAA